ncbi:DUF1761 domain-containing protein [Candidatus Kaiserbacteria bacterium]|nr:DUF1761 domain-containing protein [Candidatus Kaiserbacteria bacterium]
MTPEINYLAIVVGTIIATVVAAIWYGPIFGKKWMEIVGADPADIAARERMQKSAKPLYLIQILLTAFQVLILAHLVADTTTVSGVTRAFWIWAGFVMPTIAATAMWNNDSARISWARFLIQSGYQLIVFLIFGALLTFW